MRISLLVLTVVVLGVSAAQAADVSIIPASRLAPYSEDKDHLWNRVHATLFVRESPEGGQRVHSIDPLHYRGGRYLLEGESHKRAIGILDELLRDLNDKPAEPAVKRLLFQRDLWAAFDYVGWYPDDWVYKSHFEPAAIALRKRLAQAVRWLALDDREIAALPDNYALAIKSKHYPAQHDPEHPEKPFLPADLFDTAGPWVRFHETNFAGPMTEKHFQAAGGRAAHIVLIRLPAGRAATEEYLKKLKGGKDETNEQFPPGTMVAMVRRALAVDATSKVRATPITELVQLRVYRRIPADRRANSRSDFGEQDVYEFVLGRAALFASEHGLRAVKPDERAEPFARDEGDTFEERGPLRHRNPENKSPQLKTCIQCHQAPGVYSVLSMERGLRSPGTEPFRTYDWEVELSYTVKNKVKRYDWGLLQGILEGERK